MDENKNDKKKAAAGKPLTEEQITSTRVDRRTVLRSAGIAGIGAGALGLSGCVVVPVGNGITDSDNGPIVDGLGNGRGPAPRFFTNTTDSDNGPIVDGIGQGRGR